MKKFYSSNHQLVFVNNFEGWGEGVACPYCNSETCEAVLQQDIAGKSIWRTGCGGDISEENYEPDYISHSYTKEEKEDWQKDEEGYREANEMVESLHEAIFKGNVE